MKKIVAIKNFSSNIGSYVVGDEITDLKYDQIVKLNTLGFIEPLGYKDLVLIKRELENKKVVKEENNEL